MKSDHICIWSRKMKSSQLRYILNYVMEPRGKKSKVRIHSSPKQKQSRGFCGLVAWFALTKETPLPYFIFHTGTLFSSLQLKYIEYWPVALEQCCGLTAFTFCSLTFGKSQLSVGSTVPFTTVLFFPTKKNCDLHSGLWNLAGPLVSKFFLDVSARQGASFALVLLIALSIVYACFTKVTCSHWFENMQLYFFALRENHEVWTLLSL